MRKHIYSKDKAIGASHINNMLHYLNMHLGMKKSLSLKDIVPNYDSEKNKYFITFDQYRDTLKFLIGFTGLDNIAILLHSQAKANVSSHGVLGIAILCALDFRQAINMVLKYQRSIVQIVELQLNIEDDKAMISIVPSWDLGDMEQITLELAMGAVYKTKKLLLNQDTTEDTILFTYSSPTYVSDYPLVFDCPIHFNQHSTRLIFQKEELDVPLATSNEISNELLLQELQRQLEIVDDDSNIAFLDIIKQRIHQSVGAICSLTELSEFMSMSERHLRRCLTKHGTSFQQLIDEEKTTRAKNLLAYSNLTATEIAFKLQYSDGSHFSRSFKKITGVTPLEYRIQLENHDDNVE